MNTLWITQLKLHSKLIQMSGRSVEESIDWHFDRLNSGVEFKRETDKNTNYTNCLLGWAYEHDSLIIDQTIPAQHINFHLVIKPLSDFTPPLLLLLGELSRLFPYLNAFTYVK